MPSKSVFVPADILLPVCSDISKWATIACDQFSSEPEYWDKVKTYVGENPSTLNMMLPEAWLDGTDMEETAERINGYMAEYLKTGIFKEYKNSYIFVQRRLTNGKIRKGIIGALDLEAYEFKTESNAPVRASENTVIDRLPPRIKAREQVLLEMPHVMVLIDDAERSVIEPLADKVCEMEKLYDFELMEGGGHITGHLITQENAAKLIKSLESMSEKYGSGSLQMIVGDGNHSLAAAKICWENIKSRLTEREQEDHPARFALVELGNIHDESLEIEPIHRAVFNSGDDLPDKLMAYLDKKNINCKKAYRIECASQNKMGEIGIRASNIGEAIGLIQDFLEEYEKNCLGRIDYIHGEDALAKLTQENDVFGFYMPAIDKGDLFKSVAQGGIFPKKSFSMGNARDKRYYLELRKIK